MKENYIAKNLRILYVFNFLKSVQFFGAVAVPFFRDWAGLDYARMFTLEAFFVFSVFVLEIPTGVVADRYGRKWSLVFGGVFAAAAFVLFGFSRTFPVFLAAEFLCAIGFSLFSGADKALLYDTLKAHGKEAEGARRLSTFGAMETAGIVLGFPAGSLLAGSSLFAYPDGLRWAFVATGAVFLLSAAAALFLVEPEREKPRGSFLRSGMDGVCFIFGRERMRSFTLNYILISATTFFVYWFYQPLVAEAGFPVSANGFVGAGMNVFAALLLLNAARIEKAFPLRRLLFLSSLVPGLLYLALFLNRSAVVAFPAVFVIIGLKHLRAPFLSDLMNAEIESSGRATVLSGVSMLERAVIMLFYPLVGMLADKSLSWTFLLLGASTIFFALTGRVGVGKKNSKNLRASM
ncbi:MAG: MFS transporter [Treponemataceae bacterium]